MEQREKALIQGKKHPRVYIRDALINDIMNIKHENHQECARFKCHLLLSSLFVFLRNQNEYVSKTLPTRRTQAPLCT